jgi:hypothetical protein
MPIAALLSFNSLLFKEILTLSPPIHQIFRHPKESPSVISENKIENKNLWFKILGHMEMNFLRSVKNEDR